MWAGTAFATLARMPRPRPKRSGEFLAENLSQRLRAPRTLTDFKRLFVDDTSCRLYLAGLRWPDGFVCPRCENAAHAECTTQGLLQCTSCRVVCTPTTGTSLDRSPLPLTAWLRAIWELVSNESGADVRRLQGVLPVLRRELVVSWLRVLQDVFEKLWRQPLAGHVEVAKVPVEVIVRDERDRGRARHCMVAIAVQTSSDGEGLGLRARALPKVDDRAMISFVRSAVAEGSSVCTSAWRGYGQLNALGYDHVIAGAPDSDPAALTTVQQVASLLRMWLWSTHAIELDQLNYYLAEFTFRNTVRLNSEGSDRDALFNALLRLALEPEGCPQLATRQKSG